MAALQRELPEARFVSGALDAALVAGTDVQAVFKSPGLSPLDVATVMEAAEAIGIRAAGELGLFSQALSDLKATQNYTPQVLAVTGTNGKTTVTALTGLLVERVGKSVAVAGNIGPTLLDTLIKHLEADTLPEVWVIELSSFQLEGETGFEPSAAAVLNITQDHLDWHGSMAAYVAAKTRIFGASGLMILNREDPTSWPCCLSRCGSSCSAPRCARMSLSVVTCRSARATSGWSRSTACCGWCARWSR